jgi:CHAT domain-containing protein
LVVLSSCASAKGEALGLEGVASLATAFLAGGGESVIATRWPIDDRRSRELMLALHRGVLMGMPPHEALRRAQLEAREISPRSPSNWSGFSAWGIR